MGRSGGGTAWHILETTTISEGLECGEQGEEWQKSELQMTKNKKQKTISTTGRKNRVIEKIKQMG